jgi:hypothetical protein
LEGDHDALLRRNVYAGDTGQVTSPKEPAVMVGQPMSLERGG